MRKKIVAALIVCSMLFVLTSCGSTTSSKADSSGDGKTTTGQKAAKLKTINVGTNPGTGNIFGFIAMDKGFDEDEGYKTNLIPFDNSTDALNALQAGKVDVDVNFGTAAPLTFVTKGADFSIFGGYVSGGMPLYAAKDFQYTGLDSFKGKRIATARMYTPDIIWRGTMLKAGYNLDKDFTIMEFKKPSEVLAAVKSGQADVGVGTNSTYLGAVQSGLKIICWTNDLDPDAVCCRQVANTSWLNKNSDLAVAYLKSMLRAEEVFYNDPDYAVSIFAKNMKLDEDSARTLLLKTNQELWLDPKSNGVQDMWQTLKDLNYIDAGNIQVKDHINIALYKKALDELIKEYPKDDYFSKTLVARYQANNSRLLGK